LVNSLSRLIAELQAHPDQDSPAHRDRAFGPWREAWTLGHYIRARKPTRVRLFPAGLGKADAAIEFDSDEIEDIEITEALDIDWKPNLVMEGAISDGGPEEWRSRIVSIPQLLGAAAEKKRSKPYATKVTLLIYLDIHGTYGVATEEGLKAIHSFLASFSGDFRSLAVLWNDRVYRA
jgi:hypothetical protein